MSGRPWTMGELRTLRRMAPLTSAAVIGQELGRSVSAVRNRASIHGIPLQKRGLLVHNAKWPPELKDQVRAEHAAGATPTALAERHGLPLWRVKNWVHG